MTNTNTFKEISGRVTGRGKKRTGVVGGQRKVLIAVQLSGRAWPYGGGRRGILRVFLKIPEEPSNHRTKKTPQPAAPQRKKAQRETERGWRI